MNGQLELIKILQEVEEKAGEILTAKQEVIGLDKRRNDDRVGMRELQKQNKNNVWMTVGPLLIKMKANAAEELLVQDQRECDIEINKIRSNLKVQVNELRKLEHIPEVPGLLLKPMTLSEMAAMNQVMGKSL